MIQQKPSKTEQFNAILRGDAHSLLEQFGTDEELVKGVYDAVFNISRGEFLEFVKATYHLHELAKDAAALVDGLYAIPNQSSFLIYYQERGCRMGMLQVSSTDEAWNAVVSWLIGLSGLAHLPD